MKDIVVKLIAREVKINESTLGDLIEVPPKLEMGDFAFPCYGLAKSLKKSPLEIAEDLSLKIKSKIKNQKSKIKKVETKGAYINFFVDRKRFAEGVLDRVSGVTKSAVRVGGGGKRIGIEYPSPNTNKALHVGHLRNMAIGEAVTRLVENAGNEVFHLNLFNDRGILISKSMIGYEKFSNGKTPESEGVKGDKFVGDLYVKFSKESAKVPELEEAAKEMLRFWENEDENTRALWKRLNDWTYSGMQKTFDKFGLSPIDKSYYESEIYKKGRAIVNQGLKKGLFEKREDGAVIVNLENEKLGEKVLLRSDGTSVYITQDLYLAEQKIKDFKLDSSYYVVGSDQEYHFKVLFSILEKLGIKKDWRHLSYGMVRLPTGKMKSREGTAVSADDLIDETVGIAREGILERNIDELSEKEVLERALKIALSAIKYALLKVDIHKGMVFNPKEALSFEGDTGPYLLYSYARASSIINKVKSETAVKFFDLEDLEVRLLKKIDLFDDVIAKAYNDLAPNLVANYSFELASLFNEFYHACPVLGNDKEGFRLRIVDVFRITLKKSLGLLGIETIEEM